MVEGAVACRRRPRPAPGAIELPVVQVAPGGRRRAAGVVRPRRRRRARRGRADRRRGRRDRARRRPRRGQPARLPRRLRRLRRAARRRRARRGDAGLPELRAPLLPAARRALARRRPAAARAGAAARRRRRPAGRAPARRRAAMSESLEPRLAARRQAELVAGLRRLAPAPGAGRGATAHGSAPRPSERCDLCGNGLDRRPPPPAPPRRAPDPLRLRELPGAALRRPGAAPDGHADACGSTTSSSPTSSGRASRSRSAWRSSSTRAPPAASSPSTRARPGRPSPSSTSTPGSELRTANPVLMSLEPDAEALIVNRMAEPPEHAIAPIDECYRLVGMIKVELGGDLGRRRAGAGDRGVLRRAASESGSGRAASDGRRRRRARRARPTAAAATARSRVRGRRRSSGRAGRGADAALRRRGHRRLRARGLHDRAHRS